MVVLEFGGLAYYEYFFVQTYNCEWSEVFITSSAMFVILIILNCLCYDIYQICHIGWLDVAFKMQGITQVINMLSAMPPQFVQPEVDKEKIKTFEDYIE